MANTYTTKPGDMVDLIAYRAYGRSSGLVEAIMAANPGLAYHPPVLPGRLTIVLPDVAAPTVNTRYALWD